MFFVRTLDARGKIVVLNLSQCSSICIEAASDGYTSRGKYDIVFRSPDNSKPYYIR